MTDIIVQKNENLITKAIGFATEAHRGQMYGLRPYTEHLKAVYKVVLEFGIIDEEILTAAWLHDTIEDTDVTYTDIKRLFGDNVAELVYAVTNELGRNRKERHTKTFPKIAKSTKAKILKLSDRVANGRNSKLQSPSKFKMYQKEFNDFRIGINVGVLNPVTPEDIVIDNLFKELTAILEIY